MPARTPRSADVTSSGGQQHCCHQSDLGVISGCFEADLRVFWCVGSSPLWLTPLRWPHLTACYVLSIFCNSWNMIIMRTYQLRCEPGLEVSGERGLAWISPPMCHYPPPVCNWGPAVFLYFKVNSQRLYWRTVRTVWPKSVFGKCHWLRVWEQKAKFHFNEVFFLKKVPSKVNKL